ncbi:MULTISPECIES: O-methyltransferase [Gluconobacter]|uniref:O-methyltransferase n=1 Tax=Gluconobacter TaxID=441 RepID=UPI001C05B747|nr:MULTISPECIES: O-methyltransferase [Gluconobacter]
MTLSVIHDKTTTLTGAPVAALLERLFAEAETATNPAIADIPREEFQRLAGSRTEYRKFYGLAKHLWLPVSRETGTLLYMLARATWAKNIVEFGTSFGISTIHLAAALRDNGGGKVITTEFEPSKVARARAHLEEAGLADLVEFREGDALQTLAAGLPESIDIVLLDGAKPLYPDILDLLEDRLQAGALIVADNADHSPEYLARVRSPAAGYLSLPFAEDVELSVRLH